MGTFTDMELNDFIRTASKQQLMELKLDLGDKKTSIELQLKKHSSTNDKEWVKRAEAAATITGRQMARVDLRISELNDAAKADNSKYRKFFELAEVCSDIPLDTFEALATAAGLGQPG